MDVLPFEHAVYAVGCIFGYSYLLAKALTSPQVSRFIVGQSTVKPSSGEAPLRLPIFAFCWTLATSSAFYIWREFFRRARHPLDDDDGGSERQTIHSFLRIGWNGEFHFLGVPIDNWRAYSLLMIYQITRSVISSLLDCIYTPFMAKITSQGEGSEDELRISEGMLMQIQVGKALTTVSSTWSALTNFILTFSRLDLALAGVLVNVLTDAVYQPER